MEEVSDRLRREGKTVVQCHGVFDLLHIGHIRYLQAAKKMGDILVITVTPDQFVNKGPNRPVFSSQMRCESLASLECVDFVALNHFPTAVEAIERIQPGLYVKGSEYRDFSKDITGAIAREEEAVKKGGGELAFTNEIVFSSSALINRNFPVTSREMEGFLEEFRQKGFGEILQQRLEQVRNLNVLVLGETIIDEYHYCQTLGKSGKEPILAAKFLKSEKFAGGILAIANHLSKFCNRLDLVTSVHKNDTNYSFIENSLAENVHTHLVYANASPVVKKRFVEKYPFQKLFEVYEMNDENSGEGDQESFYSTLKTFAARADVVIVADYGHELIDSRAIEIIAGHAKFLAINTQANAGNRGFNTFGKYPHANFISISEEELRLEARKRNGPVEPLVRDAAGRMGCSRLLVTRGSKGILVYSDGNILSVPALTSHTVDRIGAGDAVFALSSLLACIQSEPEVLGLAGNAVGAQAVGSVCNRDPVDPIALKKTLSHLLK